MHFHHVEFPTIFTIILFLESKLEMKPTVSIYSQTKNQIGL